MNYFCNLDLIKIIKTTCKFEYNPYITYRIWDLKKGSKAIQWIIFIWWSKQKIYRGSSSYNVFKMVSIECNPCADHNILWSPHDCLHELKHIHLQNHADVITILWWCNLVFCALLLMHFAQVMNILLIWQYTRRFSHDIYIHFGDSWWQISPFHIVKWILFRFQLQWMFRNVPTDVS